MSTSVGGLHYDVTMELQGLIDAQRRMDQRLGDMESRGERFSGKFKAIAGAVTAALSAIAFDALVSKIVDAQRQFDVMFASLKTMTGSTEEASAAWERLVQFATKTPYSLEQAVEGFTKLTALGLDPSERAMLSYGNTASAMGKELSQMIEAVADASTGEFERLKEFGIKASVQGDSVSLTFQGVTTTIQNSASQITDYLTKIGETKFAGAMSERMKTLDGEISNLEDSIQALYLSTSQSGIGALVADGVRVASGAVQGFGEVVAQLSLEFAKATNQADILGRNDAIKSWSVRTREALSYLIDGVDLVWQTVSVLGRNVAYVFEGVGTTIGGIGAQVRAVLHGDFAGAKAINDAIIADNDARRRKLDAKDKATLSRTKLAGQAMREAWEQGAGGGRGSVNPPSVSAPNSPKKDKPPTKNKAPKKTADAKFDDAGYLAGLETASVDAWTRVGVVEDEAKRKNDKLLAEKKISHETHEKAIVLIAADAAQERQKIMDSEFDKAVEAGEKRFEEQKRQQELALQYGAGLTKAVNPVDALRQEYQAKLDVVTLYEQMMAQAGVDATEHGQMTRTQLTTEYEAQRLALAEQSFRSQGEAQAFLMDSVNAFSASATSSIMGLINGTLSAQDAMRNLAGVVLNEAVSALVQIGVQQVKNALLGNTLAAADAARKAANGAVYSASVAAQVAGMAAMAGQNAFAATAAIPIIGPGLAPAAAAAAMAVSAGLGAPAIATAPLAGARQYGGPANSGNLYRVNEKGAPEMFTAGNGQQYLMPTQSGRVTAADQIGGGSVKWTINVNNTASGTTASASIDDQSKTVNIAIAQVASQIRENSGAVWSALRGSSNVQGRM